MFVKVFSNNDLNLTPVAESMTAAQSWKLYWPYKQYKGKTSGTVYDVCILLMKLHEIFPLLKKNVDNTSILDVNSLVVSCWVVNMLIWYVWNL